MKRFTTILVLTFYTVFSCGVTVYSHYCGGKLASVSLTSSEGCNMCGKKKAKDCCKDTQQNLSLDESQVANDHNIIFGDFLNLIGLLPSNNYSFQPVFALLNAHTTQFYVFETGPPKTPIYIQIRSLLI